MEGIGILLHPRERDADLMESIVLDRQGILILPFQSFDGF